MSEALFKLELSSGSVPLEFARNSKARRYILKIRNGVARVTIPRGGTVKFASEFAHRHREWLVRQLESAKSDWPPGTLVFLRGERVSVGVKLHPAGERGVTLGIYEWSWPIELTLKQCVLQNLRAIATPELINRTFELARELGFEVRRVSVRNQSSRWGSCSVRKNISLNWKLIQTPEVVRDYIIIHELCHLLVMNHSDRFWREVALRCPEYSKAELWLRKFGKDLR
ncbi:MAG: M48 family metallopeptidase [Verrucomicrobiota bacterium]